MCLFSDICIITKWLETLTNGLSAIIVLLHKKSEYNRNLFSCYHPLILLYSLMYSICTYLCTEYLCVPGAIPDVASSYGSIFL